MVSSWSSAPPVNWSGALSAPCGRCAEYARVGTTVVISLCASMRLLELRRVGDRLPVLLGLDHDLRAVADGLVDQARLQARDERAEEHLHADADGDADGDEDGLDGTLAQEAGGDAQAEHGSGLLRRRRPAVRRRRRA